MPTLTRYLGKSATDLLASAPFSSWVFSKSIDDDLAEMRINYSCESENFDFVCDSDDRITTIFLTSALFAYQEIDLPTGSSRNDVIAAFGKPSRCGQPSNDPILGEYGAWDRYDLVNYSLHIEYRVYVDQVKMVTLMIPSVVR